MMTDAPENQSAIQMSPDDVFKRTKGDAIHSGLKVGLSIMPLAGDLFELLIATPASKRRDEFLMSVYEGLRILEQRFADFNIDTLVGNEAFTSTMIQATQVAIRTHNQEKRIILRNAVLNAAYVGSANETTRAMLVQLCDELTILHINVLKLFEREDVPLFVLGALDREKSLGHLDELCNWLEALIPEMQNRFVWYIQAVEDLHRKGLISNLSLGREQTQEWFSRPKTTSIADELLDFIKSPLGDDD